MVGRYIDDSETLLIEGERICMPAQVVIVKLVLHGEPETRELDYRLRSCSNDQDARQRCAA